MTLGAKVIFRAKVSLCVFDPFPLSICIKLYRIQTKRLSKTILTKEGVKKK